MYSNKLIINFLQTTTGGGLQNAISFLNTLIVQKQVKDNVVALVRKNTILHDILDRNKIEHIAIKDSNFNRFLFELNLREHFEKGQICFYPFGVAMLRSCNYLVNVGGCALSNLFYPEIDFWGYLPLHKKFFKYIKDYFRKLFTKRMDYWIFETEVLKERAVNSFGFPEERTIFIGMAPSTSVSQGNVLEEKTNEYKKLFGDHFTILYLSVAHPNKRIHMLPGIARELVNKGIKKFKIVTTMANNHYYTKDVEKEINKHSVADFFLNLGPIEQDKISSLIYSVDAMCNLSILESFSNNYIEAWEMEKTLIVTDANWARSICAEAAIYINPSDTNTSADVIKELIENLDLNLQLRANGKKHLKKYNTPTQKNLKYLKAIEEAEKSGSLSRKQRKSVFKYRDI